MSNADTPTAPPRGTPVVTTSHLPMHAKDRHPDLFDEDHDDQLFEPHDQIRGGYQSIVGQKPVHAKDRHNDEEHRARGHAFDQMFEPHPDMPGGYVTKGVTPGGPRGAKGAPGRRV